MSYRETNQQRGYIVNGHPQQASDRHELLAMALLLLRTWKWIRRCTKRLSEATQPPTDTKTPPKYQADLQIEMEHTPL